MENIDKKEDLPFRFKVSGNIIRKLGGESISNKNIAVLELIKNSYDAGSNKVEIQIKHEDVPESAAILVSDDGDGMTLSDIENKWMNIATPNKSKILINKKAGRPLVGEKGLGRLSSESLGKKTFLLTKPVSESKGYGVEFDWEKYQKENVLVSEVINGGFSFEKKKKEHGTTLEITNLNHDWNDLSTQKSLLKDIYLLNPPNKIIKDFKVVPKFHKQIKDFKKIRKSFLSLSAYFLKTKLLKGNIIRYEFSTINGKKKTGAIQLDNKLKCGDACFELFMYYRSAKYLRNALGRELTQQEVNEINGVLDEYSGIKLYRDNFRVKPYGDSGNDWIGLDLEAQNNSMCPRNNALFGIVSIGKNKNPRVVDTTTREGVLFTDEFKDLISFVRTSILEIFIDLRSHGESFKKKARKNIETPIQRAVSEQKRVSVAVFPTLSERTERYIEVKGDYPQNFYLKLEQEINDCYKAGFLNASFLLSRKIIESLMYDILCKKFPSEKGLWWHEEFNQPKALSPLLKSLYDNRKRFEPNVTRFIEKSYNLLDEFRNAVNTTAHNIYDYIGSKDELDKFKINDIVQLLVNVWANMPSSAK